MSVLLELLGQIVFETFAAIFEKRFGQVGCIVVTVAIALIVGLIIWSAHD